MNHWNWASASRRGVAHVRAGMPLQDACAVFAPTGFEGGIVAIVSDGAGSAEYGGQGAWLTCREIASAARRHFSSCCVPPSDETFLEWLDALRDRIAVAADRRERSLRDFAATLVCVISNGHELVVAHVGDGGVAYRGTTDREWLIGSWPDHGEFAATTFFVTDENGPRLRISRHAGEVSALAVFSDGIERIALDFAGHRMHGPFLEPMIRPLLASAAVGKDRELSRKLSEFLDSSVINARTDDDKTLVLLAKR